MTKKKHVSSVGNKRAKEKQLVVFLKTSTAEKIRHFNAICENKHLPILFLNSSVVLGTQHTTIENKGSVAGNNEDKFSEFNGQISDAAEDDSPINSNIRRILKKFKIRYNPKNIFFATEDSGWGIESKTIREDSNYEEFKNVLQALAPADVIDKATGDIKNPNRFFIYSEIAPILSAVMGMENLLKALNILEIPDGIASEDRTELRLASIADIANKSGASTSPFDARVSQKYKKGNPVDGSDTTYPHCVDDDGNFNTSDYLFGNHPRSLIIQGVAKTNAVPKTKQSFKISTKSQDLKYVTTENLHKASLPLTKRDGKNVYIENTSYREKVINIATLMHSQLIKADDHIKKADAFIFEPYEKQQHEGTSLDPENIAKEYLLSSFVVARQLSLREMNKPFIVKNLNGCYDEELQTISYLNRMGMCKDFCDDIQNITPEWFEEFEKKGLTLRRGMYFDVLSGSDAKQINEASKRLLKEHKEKYFRPPALQRQDNKKIVGNKTTFDGRAQETTFAKAIDKGENFFKVGIFLSASSENKELNETTKDFSKWLAENNYGVVYGGGDRYMMGAVLDGYTEGRKPNQGFIAGFSTPEIIKSEAKYGRFPEELDAAVVNKEIYERMAQMIALTDDVIVIRAGGAGTIQELAAVLLMKEVFKDVPEIKNKKIIIQNPGLIALGGEKFYDPILKNLFGNKWEQLRDETDNFEGTLSNELGVFIASDDEQVKTIIKSAKKSWEEKLEEARDASHDGYMGISC